MISAKGFLRMIAVLAVAAPLAMTRPASAAEEEEAGKCKLPMPFGHCCDCTQDPEEGTKCKLTHNHASSSCSSTCPLNDCQT